MSAPAPVRAGRHERHLHALPTPALRVCDVALFYGERSGGIRTYVDAKAAWARETGAIEHHLVVPGPDERHRGHGGAHRHELRSLRLATANGYRLPLGAAGLRSTLEAIAPDVVLLHDPFWRPLDAAGAARDAGARVVAVHHGSAALDARALAGPQWAYQRAFRAVLRRAYAPADAVMAACDPRGDCGRPATIPLRFGLHPAFRPQPGVARGDHVLYAGRLAREKGVFELLEAAAASSEPWPLMLIGAGPAEAAIRARARRLGIARRVRIGRFLTDRHALARAYAAAACVVMPGPLETFGLVALEAAASGARVVAAASAPSARLAGPLAERFVPADARSLARAVERARRAPRDPDAASRLAAEHGWDGALRAETAALRALVRGAGG